MEAGNFLLPSQDTNIFPYLVRYNFSSFQISPSEDQFQYYSSNYTQFFQVVSVRQVSPPNINIISGHKAPFLLFHLAVRTKITVL